MPGITNAHVTAVRHGGSANPLDRCTPVPFTTGTHILARMLDALRSDAGYAVRQVRRTPLRSITAILTLSVGIAVAGAAVSLVRSIQTLPAPGIQPDERVVRIRGLARRPDDSQSGGRALSVREVDALVARREVFASVAAWNTETGAVAFNSEETASLAGLAFASANYFDVLGVRPMLGRAPHEVGEALISESFWRTRTGADSSVIGRSIRVDGMPVTVVGVAPQHFTGTDLTATPLAVWLPLSARSTTAARTDSTPLSVVARLAPGVTLPQASAAATLVAGQHAPSRPAGLVLGADVVPLLAGNSQPVQGGEVALGVVTTLALLVLIVVCLTVGTLLAGGVVTRRRELGIRVALGGTRMRIARLLLAESLVLALLGAGLGTSLLWTTWRVANASLPIRPVLDWGTMGWGFAIVVVAGCLAGLAPALRASRTDIAGLLHGTTSTGSRLQLALQRRLVVMQVALTQPLLLGLVLLVQVAGGDLRSASTPDAAQVVLVHFDRIGTDMPRAERTVRLQRARERLAALPGVTGLATQPGGFSGADVRMAGSDGPARRVRRHDLDPGFLDVAGLRVRQGRAFVPGDTGVVLVGAMLARQLWEGANPVGQRLRLDGENPSTLAVIGVIDATGTPVEESAVARSIYLPVGNQPDVGIFHAAYLRTSVPAATIVASATAALREELPGITVTRATTLEAFQRDAWRTRLTTAGAAAGGGVIALLIAAVGLFATGALAVSERTREIGIRAALGATSRRLVLSFFLGGTRLAATGLLLGLPLSLAALRWLVPVDLPAIAPGLATALAVAVIASIAAYVPAAHAGRANPAVTLRSD